MHRARFLVELDCVDPLAAALNVCQRACIGSDVCDAGWHLFAKGLSGAGPMSCSIVKTILHVKVYQSSFRYVQVSPAADALVIRNELSECDHTAKYYIHYVRRSCGAGCRRLW